MFGHEKFRAYQLSIEFVALVSPIIEDLPKGNAHLIDQLRRASISIPLNIAEGSGKTSEKDKRRFYSIARGSTMECAAILDVFICTKTLDEQKIHEPRARLSEVAGILSKICLQK